MDKKGIIKHKKVFDQWLEGETVQMESYGEKGNWVDMPDHINFNLNYNYRIKPEKKTVKLWINIYPNGEVSRGHRSKAGANSIRGQRCEAVVCVDITYEVGEGLESSS